MNGTTEYVAPSDICTQRLNRISVAIAAGSTVCCEKSIRARPSRKRIVRLETRRVRAVPTSGPTCLPRRRQGCGRRCSSDRTGRPPGLPCEAEVEVVVEVQRRDVVDRQFNTEAGAVDHEECPDPLCPRKPSGTLPSTVAWRSRVPALGRQILVASVRRVLGELPVQQRGREQREAREPPSPGASPAPWSAAKCHHGREDQRHRHLRHAAHRGCPSRQSLRLPCPRCWARTSPTCGTG